MKVFQPRGFYNVKGKVLPRDKFKPYRELENAEFNPKRMEKVVLSAEKFLDAEVPMLPASRTEAN